MFHVLKSLYLISVFSRIEPTGLVDRCVTPVQKSFEYYSLLGFFGLNITSVGLKALLSYEIKSSMSADLDVASFRL